MTDNNTVERVQHDSARFYRGTWLLCGPADGPAALKGRFGITFSFLLQNIIQPCFFIFGAGGEKPPPNIPRML